MGPAASRVVFFGMPCAFSLPSLEALFDAGHRVVGVVVPRTAPSDVAVECLRPGGSAHVRPLPMLGPRGLIETAWAHDVPVLQVRGLERPEAIDAIRRLRPDVGVVACFPRRIPPSILTLPALGMINVHPSLLPANRGPAPLFWTFYQGEEETGVTVHVMDEGLDTGPIVLQERMAVPNGIWGADLELQLARRGGALAARAVEMLASGTAAPRPQSETGVSYFPAPGENDLLLRPNLPARAVFGFVRGAVGLGYPLSVQTEAGRRAVLDAAGYATATDAVDLPPEVLHTLGAPVREQSFVCRDGEVRLLVGP